MPIYRLHIVFLFQSLIFQEGDCSDKRSDEEAEPE